MAVCQWILLFVLRGSFFPCGRVERASGLACSSVGRKHSCYCHLTINIWSILRSQSQSILQTTTRNQICISVLSRPLLSFCYVVSREIQCWVDSAQVFMRQNTSYSVIVSRYLPGKYSPHVTNISMTPWRRPVVFLDSHINFGSPSR